MNKFIERYRQLGFEFKNIAIRPCIRMNALKNSEEEFKERMNCRKVSLEKVPFLKNGFYVKSKFSPGSTPEYLLGMYYLQEAASQIPVEVLDPEGVVLDCCAAPGGKTTQIAESAEAVVALEPNYNRMNSLINNIERMGAGNCIVYNVDARSFEGNFDKVLVDAPCSGNYVTDSKWFEKQSVENFRQRANLQREILAQAFECLRPGGELVYSTCSLEPEEDEMVVDWFLKNFDVKIMPIKTIGVDGITNPFGIELEREVRHAKRIWPSLCNTQGFFIAKFRKK